MCLTKIPTHVDYIFSKYVNCDMRFLVEKKNEKIACFLDDFGIADAVFSY